MFGVTTNCEIGAKVLDRIEPTFSSS